ncbi:hypothetical protein ABH931_007013 [Streptacidiphilus sp. MAP12-33]|uniref:condensation domain-containing protein n=1 Tax=Streptacidiphilus sp. MAP12-33 TaxID=3156266 RepID=UPI0035173D42
MSAQFDLPTLSYQQGRLLMDEHAQREQLPSLRTIAQAYRIEGPFDEAALAAALTAVAARHQALRATFPTDAYTQTVHEGEPVPVTRVSVAAQGDPRLREEEALAAARRAAVEPFDTARGPRLRATVIELAPRERILVLAFDHLVLDAWSRSLVLGELTHCYAAARAGHEAALPEVEYSYADHVRQQQELLGGPEYGRLLDYWSGTLGVGGAIPVLGVGRAAAGTPVGCGTQEVEVPTAVAEGLRGLAARERSTLFLLVLCALQLALAARSARSRQATAVNLYNRDRIGTERLVAPLAELMVVSTDLDGAGSFREALRRVRAATLDAQEHAELPYPELVKALSPELYARPDAPVGVVLNMLYAELLDEHFRPPDTHCRPLVLDQAPARPRSELMIVGRTGAGRLTLAARYQRDRVDDAFVADLLAEVCGLLTEAVESVHV